jgi:hydroxymethylpyrimidine pyrophosphatase-like HAD family hydrolase
MRYLALATDYDGTLAHHGAVDDETVEHLKKFLASGRRLIMVTGRELPELKTVCPSLDLFEWVVAENGGLLYCPATKEEKPLADPPKPEFVQELKRRGVERISVGRVIVATWEPHETTCLEVIREMGLELQVIFNKGAVMILPANVNKASGLKAALKVMNLSPHNVVAVGDAENDHAMLRMCEVSAAVLNALPAVKDTADIVTTLDHGKGVSQLITGMLRNDLSDVDRRLSRHYLPIGKAGDEEVCLPPYTQGVLICGPSASGKSTVATRIVESLIEQRYQFCLIDPEGDYEKFEGAIVFGGPQSPPPRDEILRLLDNPMANAVVCMTGMKIADRPPFFLNLMADLLQRRSSSGHPHWLVLDEAHHLMPADWKPAEALLPEKLHNTLLITVHPELLPPAVLERVQIILAVGQNAKENIAHLATAVGEAAPAIDAVPEQPGELLYWRRGSSDGPKVVKAYPSKTERHRHRRKYVEGELAPDRSFYFTGPGGAMNLRAQNIMMFLQLAEGLDDDTWMYHLRRGDYSKWFRGSIKDDSLADDVARIEEEHADSPSVSRVAIRTAIERDYTLPASVPMPVNEAS